MLSVAKQHALTRLAAVTVDQHAAAQPQLATEPLEVSAAVEADPLFGAEQRTLPQDQWHAVLERLVGMMQQVADALGDMSAYASDYSEQLRQDRN